MPLPIKPLPIAERWSCHQCGVCCKGSIVPLSADDVARLQSQHWEERPDYAEQPVMVRESWLGHEYRLAPPRRKLRLPYAGRPMPNSQGARLRRQAAGLPHVPTADRPPR